MSAAQEFVEAGGRVDEPGFYDLAMTCDGEPAMLPLERSPWLPVYDEAARWIPSSASVVDLGCGTGRFLARLATTTHHGTLAGIDFSAAAISEAGSYLRGYFADDVDFYHRVTLRVEDLRSWQPTDDLLHASFACLEVLEHLEDDLGLVRRVPPGAQLVFSVPSYLSAAHVRCFGALADVFARYGALLSIRRWSLVDFGGGNVIHVVDSTRRTDSW